MPDPSQNAPYQAARYGFAPVAAFFDTDAQGAELLQTSRRTIQRWRREGLSLTQAENIADLLGEHPFCLWPDMRDDLIEQCDEEEMARRRRWRRNWYRNASPEVTERTLAAARAYKRSAARALRLYSRRYREQNKEQIAARQRAHYLANRSRILARQREYDRRRAQRRQEVA